MSFQTTFIELIKDRIPEHISLVDELAELLSISSDSAYRRLRNDTPLSLEESVKICLHFDISPATILDQATDLIPFRYNQLYNTSNSFMNYLGQLTQTIHAVAQAGGHIYYAAEDIPLFHHFGFPNLSSFKLFYWNKAVLDDEGLEGKTFSSDLIHPDLQEAASKLLEAYYQVNSTEIWTEESINSTIKQIQYFAESYQFSNKDEVFAVIDDLQKLIDKVKEMASKSSKSESATSNYTLFNSDVLIGNNSIVIEGLDKPVVFLSHNTFNSLSTRDHSFHKETMHWMNNLMKKSTQISGISERQRISFFKKLDRSVEELRSKIDKLDI